MKKILLLLTFIGLLTSCDWLGYPKPNTDLITNFDLNKEYTIPVKSGHYSIVTVSNPVTKGGVIIDTIAVTNTATTMDIDQYANPSVEYVSELVYNPTITGKNYKRNFILAFEDLGGDMDYNDLIVRVDEKLHFDAGANKSHSLTFTINPIARGAISSSKLGFILYINDRLVLSGYVTENVKSDLFKNYGDFINTFMNLPHVDLPIYSKVISFGNENLVGINLQNDIKFKIAYFLEIGPGRNYIAMTNKPLNEGVSYNSQINGNGYPYGLFIPGTTFDYPQEGKSIKSIYLDFDLWKIGARTTFLTTNRNPEFIYTLN